MKSRSALLRGGIEDPGVNATLGPPAEKQSIERERYQTDRHYLLELGVFGLGFLEGKEVRVSVFPCGEEVLIGGAGFGGVVLQGVGASEAELGEGECGAAGIQVAVLGNFAEFDGGVDSIFYAEVDEAASI